MADGNLAIRIWSVDPVSGTELVCHEIRYFGGKDVRLYLVDLALGNTHVKEKVISNLRRVEFYNKSVIKYAQAAFNLVWQAGNKVDLDYNTDGIILSAYFNLKLPALLSDSFGYHSCGFALDVDQVFEGPQGAYAHEIRLENKPLGQLQLGSHSESMKTTMVSRVLGFLEPPASGDGKDIVARHLNNFREAAFLRFENGLKGTLPIYLITFERRFISVPPKGWSIPYAVDRQDLHKRPERLAYELPLDKGVLPFEIKLRLAQIQRPDGEEGFAGTKPEVNAPLDWYVGVRNFMTLPILEMWNELVSFPYRDGLQTVTDPSSLSIVPVLKSIADPKSRVWDILCPVRDLIGTSNGSHTDKKIERLGWPTIVHKGDASKDVERPKVSVHLAGFFNQSGETMRLEADLAGRGAKVDSRMFASSPMSTDRVPDYVHPNSALYDFTLSALVKKWDAPVIRIGALDFELADPDKLKDTWSITASIVPDVRPGAGAGFDGIALEAKGKLRAHRVWPSAQDPVPDEDRAPLGRSKSSDLATEEKKATERKFEREPALVFPIGDETPAREYELSFQEVTEKDRSRNLTVQLLGKATDDKASRAIVVDRQPFTVAEVEVPPFGVRRSGLAGTEIANWEISEVEGRKWEIAGLEDGARVRLPPQAVGEEMEKGDHFYQAFVADRTNRPIGADDEFATPFPPPPLPTPPSPQPREGYEPRVLDYRFSPPARFTIRTSYFDQRYVEAPWNLRRVFGYVGQRAPGAGIDQFDFELLYGLKGHAEGIPFLRLAEVESRMGAIPPRIPIIPDPFRGEGDDAAIKTLKTKLQKAYEDHWRRWANVTQAYRSRLGVLQLWAEGRSGELRLEKGIDYELVDFERERGTLATAPEATLTADPIDPRPGTAGHEIGKRRFFGGAEWGFESRNILNSVRRNRKSVSGELRRPGFSALGGFGWLKASFDNDLTRIYADVQLGRANFYSVERIGRIANLWHRAKHVIVYERTVVPSRQFRAQQPRHEGRPVVRKVQEYIELLEPIRRYPDGNGTARLRACLLGVDFKSRIIPVDGRWGYDIGDIGWAIPLWKPDADPEVYPKPQIMAMGAPDPESGAPFMPGIFEKPEKLLFFTQTLAGTDSNTDAWPARVDIDYCDEPARLPEYLDPNKVIDGEGPERRLPDPPAIEGCDRFTYEVNFGGRAVNLAAGRSSEAGGEVREIAMNAVLENITFMRANPTPAPSDDAAAAARNLFAMPVVKGDGVERPTNPLGEALRGVDAVLQDLVRTASEAAKGLTDVNLGSVQDLVKTVFLDATSGQLKTEIRDRVLRVQNELEGKLTDAKLGPLDNLYKAVSGECEKLKRRPKTLLDSARKPFVDKLTDAANEIDRAVTLLTSADNELKAEAFDLIDQQITLAEAALRPFSIGVDQLLGNVGALRGDIAQIRAELIVAIAMIRERIDFLAGIIKTEFQNAKAAAAEFQGRLRDLKARLLAARERARNVLSKHTQGQFSKAARSALQTAEQAFALVLMAVDRADAQLGRIIDASAFEQALLDGLQEAQAVLNSTIEKLGSAADDWLKGASDALTAFEGETAIQLRELNAWPDALRAEVRTLIGNLGGGELNPDNIAKKANQAILDLQAAVVGPRGKLDRLVTEAEARINQLCGTLFEHLDSTVALAGALEAEITAYINDKLKHLFLDEAGNAIARSVEDVQAYLDSSLGQWRGQYNEFEDKLRNYVSQAHQQGLFQAGSAALRLMRGYGEAPILPQLKFNRDRLAYVFDDAREAILSSPVAAMVNDVGQVLNGLGLRVPTQELLDRIIPHNIEETLVAKVTEHLAGIRFLNMFSGLKMPAVAKDAIQIRHGLDKATQTAWLNADLRMPFGPATLFDLGPLNLKILAAKLTAYARLTARLGEAPQQETYGELYGDWQLGFGGTKLVTFTRTTVSFDKSGDFNFDIRPDRIELDKAMEWLADLVQSWSDPDSGFLLELYEEGGRPRGVRAMLDLPVPPIAAGAFAMSGLRLTSFLALRYGALAGGGDDFIVEAGASLGRKDAPFALTVYFLRGGGWLEAKALYATSSGRLSVAVTIGIIVGAGAEINFGPVNGAVSLEIGIFVEFYKNIGGGQGFSIGLLLLIRGRVMVIQIVCVCLTLMLTLTYTASNGSMIGRGYLSITVKISRFFKYTVRQDVQYKLK